MKTPWAAVLTGGTAVLLASSDGASDNDGLRQDHYWDHDRHGAWRHDHYWDHARADLSQPAMRSGTPTGAPSPAPAQLLAAGFPAVALIGGSVGLRNLMRAMRRRTA